VPLSNHPGVFLAMPSSQSLARAATAGFDVLLAQTGSGLLDLGVWLRAGAGVPLLCVNTIHLPSVYNVLLPDALNARADVTEFFDEGLIPRIERLTASAYNQSDGLIVLSEGLERYWRERGVTVPIHVIPRAVDPSLFDGPPRPDPFPGTAARGARLLCVCRHAREKNVDRVIRVFARSIAPRLPASTLTLIGDGPEHDDLRALAERLGVAHRVHFLGEFPVTEVARFYRYADLFVYASLSETYGQVVSEALWCGLPVVAFEDGMGVSHQVKHDGTGLLIRPDEADADQRFAAAILELLEDAGARRAFSDRARRAARERCAPELAVRRYYDSFLTARQHCARTWRPVGWTGRAVPLARWAALHTLLAGLGKVRAPATLNRHGRRQPSWDELLGAGRDEGLQAAQATAA
jgi:glycosyltransferase involved in cell wall biosynthesis